MFLVKFNLRKFFNFQLKFLADRKSIQDQEDKVKVILSIIYWKFSLRGEGES